MTVEPSVLPLLLGGGGVGAVIMALIAWRREPREARTAEFTDAGRVVTMYQALSESHARQIEHLESRNRFLTERVGSHEARIRELEERLRRGDADREEDARKWASERAGLLDSVERLRREKKYVESELMTLKRRTADA